ncbi:undecaprenyldiphospho-muramoylpentapeptide beta-N-acetylglucosaminyltransferase, partial [Ectothiorhodospiraceae bacterium WFHF3C12]|nr:undecaprenyldiphospho-muramoylpentapeptide beta-N-acetylglucosaminyltransferase [Ectothiorhodospiraceae bacterium WFHF3C12]
GQALRAMRRYRPRAVLGMGGYAAGPGAVAAWLLRRPLLIHEQNAVPGFTNRILARLAGRVMTGFSGTFAEQDNVTFTGNPVRQALSAVPAPAERLGGREGRLRMLVVGGSLGALALNQRVPEAVALLDEASRPEIRHQAGERTLEQARQAYAEAGVDATILAFIDDMAEALQWADVVICRAGALTVAELAAAGVAAILVPYPHAVDDHQTANARYLADPGAAVLIQQSELTAERLAAEIAALAGDRSRVLAMSTRARELGRPEATRKVADFCLEAA